MKKLSPLLAIIAIAVSAFALLKSYQSDNYVYVDINKLLEGYKRTEVVKVEYEKKAKNLQSNVDSLIVGWQKELKIYEKERSKYTKKERVLKQELLGNKQKQISNYQDAVNRQIQEEDQKATQTIINDINDFVKEYGKKNGYKIIFGASGSGNIMYASEGTDLTDTVLNGLNEEFSGDVTKE